MSKVASGRDSPQGEFEVGGVEDAQPVGAGERQTAGLEVKSSVHICGHRHGTDVTKIAVKRVILAPGLPLGFYKHMQDFRHEDRGDDCRIQLQPRCQSVDVTDRMIRKKDGKGSRRVKNERQRI